ncbi:biotin-dependent carboxyltransferase family protein [Marinobacterium sp. D7]|uniref:5-oxoprolinase subunit C family protein n=1 Tax=Marinobacterium ramblicola TaxID=2849041 RepID=UPI001C2D8F13|nr:biotin-dependent carboxyltransferase family protein [Marinobacterium ramblicola]MBV1787571.1 biotin-dependent carboxyltransferase family protein [Marinobacterium ramblicola]
MSGFNVRQPGLMTLITDSGRIGHHRIGLTTGGPLDPMAFAWANRLLGNEPNATALEISIGSLVLEAQVDTWLVLTGGELPLKINGKEMERWQAHRVNVGDRIEAGFSQAGARGYLAVSGGFDIPPTFGSTATVQREKLGGLNGQKLQSGDRLPCASAPDAGGFRLPAPYQPNYRNTAPLRVILGYQQDAFSAVQKQLFFTSSYRISDRADRMGYRLEGPAIPPSINGILSEGICLGAIQVPSDGQPIVLLNDRQTIGGYPKIGSLFSQDLARLAQMLPGTEISFTPFTQDEAHNQLLLNQRYYSMIEPIAVTP